MHDSTELTGWITFPPFAAWLDKAQSTIGGSDSEVPESLLILRWNSQVCGASSSASWENLKGSQPVALLRVGPANSQAYIRLPGLIHQRDSQIVHAGCQRRWQMEDTNEWILGASYPRGFVKTHIHFTEFFVSLAVGKVDLQRLPKVEMADVAIDPGLS